MKSGAGAATSRPLFFDGAVIEGSVEMIFIKAQSIHSVRVIFEGHTLTSRSGAVPTVFLSFPHDVWTEDAAGDKLPARTYHWPFTLPLPTTVTVNKQGETPLPPTCAGTGWPVYLEYAVKVKVIRGALQADDELTVPIVYLPRSRPRPASALRELAYTHGTDSVGPEGDPDGWHAIHGKIKGTLFSKLEVEVACTLSLAVPLVYARGTAIPFMPSFESSNTQALDVFSQSSSVKAVLIETTSIGSQAKPSIVGCGRCVPSSGQSAPVSRRLEGEIPVARDLKPPFAFPGGGGFARTFAVSVTVDTVGFIPAGKLDHAVGLAQKVAVATDRPRGPSQRLTVPHDNDTTPHETYDRATLMYY